MVYSIEEDEASKFSNKDNFCVLKTALVGSMKILTDGLIL